MSLVKNFNPSGLRKPSIELGDGLISLGIVFLKLKSALQGPRQFLITESPLKMMKNAFFSP